MRTITSLLAGAMLFLMPLTIARSQMNTGRTISEKQASHFAALALKCVTREFPNKPEHVINNSGEVQSPKVLHPAFYGCYDWHSSVHGHWMLIRLLKTFPTLPESSQIRDALNANLTAESVQAEVAYLKQPNRQSFERTYGWAWALKLAAELHEWSDPEGKRWSENLKPLAETIASSYRTFLPKQTYPIRTGVHPNTAFGLAFALDYAKTTGDRELETLLNERSRTYFAKDTNYPGAWEPGGEDFFSAALMEADLMRRVLSPAEFAAWFQRFLPGVSSRVTNHAVCLYTMSPDEHFIVDRHPALPASGGSTGVLVSQADARSRARVCPRSRSRSRPVDPCRNRTGRPRLREPRRHAVRDDQ
jgi:hypothetical protein